MFSALMLAACAQPAGGPGEPAPAPAPALEVHSELARRIQADMVRLETSLREPGVVAAEIGQTADLGGGLVVRPYAIIEDSRCPPGTRCLWPGRMRIRASVSGRESELELGQTLETPGGPVIFAVASPSPWPEWPDQELGPRPPYRFGFRRA